MQDNTQHLSTAENHRVRFVQGDAPQYLKVSMLPHVFARPSVAHIEVDANDLSGPAAARSLGLQRPCLGRQSC